MGKGLSYFMVYSLVAVYILCVVPRLFSLNQIAIPGVLTLFTLPYLTACIFFAMTASIAIRNRETCMLLFVFTSVPLLFLSGISWPGSAMPSFWSYFFLQLLSLAQLVLIIFLFLFVLFLLLDKLYFLLLNFLIFFLLLF